MSKNQNTFAKRRREIEKKRKAEEKRERRRQKKEQGDGPVTPEILSPSDWQASGEVIAQVTDSAPGKDRDDSQ